MKREEEILLMLREVFNRHKNQLKGYQVILFGSRAKGSAKPRSDFDVAVIGTETLNVSDFYEISDALEDLPTLYKIDWVDLAKTTDNFKKEALNHSRVLYEG